MNATHSSQAGTIEVVTTYLQMFAPPVPGPEPAPPSVRLERVEDPTVPLYRFLYGTVGEPWTWYERLAWSDADLAATIRDPAVDLLLLSVGGQPAGYAELDRRRMPEIELAYFGLMPDFIGRGLGRWMLRETVARAWSFEPTRLWVHTCTLDHPKALGLYEACGFRRYAQERQVIADPRRSRS